MIVLDVYLGLTKTKVCKVLDQNVCHVFAPDRSSLQKSKASLLLEERVPLFIGIVDKDLHEDDDGSVDNEEELVHVCLHRVKVSTRLALKVQKVEKKNSPPIQALTGLIVGLVQEWMQQPCRFHHLGGDQVQEESWWEEEVQGLPGQKDLPCFFNAP